MNDELKEFDEIRPYEPEEMKQAFEDLLHDRQFAHMIHGFVPWMPSWLRNGILRLLFAGVKTPLDFQKRFMKPIIRYLIRTKTNGLSFDDITLKGMSRDNRYTFLSNHRDIVLDSAFLDLLLFDAGYPTTVEIGIGDNLLIYPWIKRLVRMNKAFTVRRGLTPHEMMRSSQLMSSYIHYAVNRKKENIWLAQREGRAKDSDDRTQESVLKMLAMGCEEENPADKLRDLNIVPLTISYEFDPCDYLKAQEFQEKRDIPHFRLVYLAIRDECAIVVVHLSMCGLMSCATCLARSSIPPWLIASTARFIVTTHSIRATILLSTSWKEAHLAQPITQGLTANALTNILRGNFAR